QYAEMVIAYIQDKFGGIEKPVISSPIMKSQFKQLQLTGREAEFYFMNNFQSVKRFDGGVLDDARLFGDGYDFQIRVESSYFLVEVKGVRESIGAVRLTENEYEKAIEYKDVYGLVIVSNLDNLP